jgi:hypothetical protein
MTISKLEEQFSSLWSFMFPKIQLESEGIILTKINPDTGKKNRFRFDFYHPQSKVAIEINGGTWGKSGHSSGRGLQRDYIKLNLAISEGWVVFQLSSTMINYYWINAIAETILKRIE